jgi:cation transport regulator ChaB
MLRDLSCHQQAVLRPLLRVSFAVINNSERRKEDENRKKTTHRITFGALRRSLGARENSPAPHSLSSQKKTAVPQKNSRPVFFC